MRILFTICGRAGSKGIKNKNLKAFLGYPLPFYTVSLINLFVNNNAQYECEIVLNTDSDELIRLFKNKLTLPIHVVERAPELAEDNTPKVQVIQNSYIVLKERLKKDYNIINVKKSLFRMIWFFFRENQEDRIFLMNFQENIQRQRIKWSVLVLDFLL